MNSGGYKQLLNNAYGEPPTLDIDKSRGTVYSIDEDEADEVPLFQQNKTIIRIDNPNRYTEHDSSSDYCVYLIILIVTFLVIFGTLFIKYKWDLVQ